MEVDLGPGSQPAKSPKSPHAFDHRAEVEQLAEFLDDAVGVSAHELSSPATTPSPWVNDLRALRRQLRRSAETISGCAEKTIGVLRVTLSQRRAADGRVTTKAGLH